MTIYEEALQNAFDRGLHVIENCAPHSRYFSDELGALIF